MDQIYRDTWIYDAVNKNTIKLKLNKKINVM